jgi:hypothetical protein
MNLLRHVIAGALIAALPVGSALACNTAAWNGTAGANAAVSDDPDSNNATNGPTDLGAVPRYAGRCGLMTAAAGNSFVGDNSPNNETVYRARFYVRAGQAGSKIFSATSADNGGGTEVVGITFTGTAFQFDVNGAAAVSTTGTITSGPWYSIEISYDDNGPFSATVASGGANAPTTQTVNTAGNAGALTVGSVRVGHISGGGAGPSTFIDEFDSSRGATAIGRLCPGDANASGGRTVADAALIRNESLTTNTQDLITGQPDANDNGSVTVADAAIIRNLALLNQGACPAI